jgi:pimeloyl-ACP methyl ester carboxylesterase
MAQSKTIVFLHGLFQNPRSWERWVRYFAGLGYECSAPAYPFHDGEPADLRKNINPGLGQLTFLRVVDNLSTFIDTLPEPPVLIGHSMGGLAVQKLVSLNRGVAGVCIDTAPPKGVFSIKWSFLRVNLPTINPLKGKSPCLPSVAWFHYAFCNTMTLEQTQKEYDLYVVPESRNIPRSSTGADGYVDFKKPHVPLLFIAGAKDNIIPSSLNLANFKVYMDPHSMREFKEFPDRTHYICGQPGWQEVAQYIAEWISRLMPATESKPVTRRHGIS